MATNFQISPLSSPQVNLLLEIAVQSRFVVDYFPPAKALVRKGLCQWGEKRNSRLEITKGGREWIDDNQERIQEVKSRRDRDRKLDNAMSLLRLMRSNCTRGGGKGDVDLRQRLREFRDLQDPVRELLFWRIYRRMVRAGIKTGIIKN